MDNGELRMENGELRIAHCELRITLHPTPFALCPLPFALKKIRASKTLTRYTIINPVLKHLNYPS
jgi:hypothetical protein